MMFGDAMDTKVLEVRKKGLLQVTSYDAYCMESSYMESLIEYIGPISMSIVMKSIFMNRNQLLWFFTGDVLSFSVFKF